MSQDEINKILAGFDKLPPSKQSALVRKIKQIVGKTQRHPTKHRAPVAPCKRLH